MMCNGDKKCKSCASKKQSRLGVNLSRNEMAPLRYEGKDYIIVPVIMAKNDVVMNGAIFPEEEMFAPAWNGVPVTVGHPHNTDGSFLSANAPEVLTDWCVGRIFNATVENGVLKGEAWIEVERANRINADLIPMLEKNNIDVSTGYYCEDEDVSGTINGKDYVRVSRGIQPDHLALLPNDEGACNWDDGCGVRSNNKEKGIMSKVKQALAVITNALIDDGKKSPPVKNARGSSDDRRQQVANLISHDKSPFTGDDNEALNFMSDAALGEMHKQYCSELVDDPEDKSKKNAAADDMGDEEEEEDEVVVVMKKQEKDMAEKKNELSKEDREALEHARRVFAEHRNGLVARITSNSNMKADALADYTIGTLETIANGLPEPSVSFEGRPVPHAATNAADAEAISSMMPTGIVASIQNAKKKETV